MTVDRTNEKDTKPPDKLGGLILPEGRLTIRISREDIMKIGLSVNVIQMLLAIRENAINVSIHMESDFNGLEELECSANRLLDTESVELSLYEY